MRQLINRCYYVMENLIATFIPYNSDSQYPSRPSRMRDLYLDNFAELNFLYTEDISKPNGLTLRRTVYYIYSLFIDVMRACGLLFHPIYISETITYVRVKYIKWVDGVKIKDKSKDLKFGVILDFKSYFDFTWIIETADIKTEYDANDFSLFEQEVFKLTGLM